MLGCDRWQWWCQPWPRWWRVEKEACWASVSWNGILFEYTGAQVKRPNFLTFGNVKICQGSWRKMNTWELETCWMNHRPLGHKAWIFLCFFWMKMLSRREARAKGWQQRTYGSSIWPERWGMVGCWSITCWRKSMQKEPHPLKKNMFFFAVAEFFHVNMIRIYIII